MSAMMMIESDKLRKMANYVAAAQKVLEKQSAFEALISEKAPEVAALLVDRGQLSGHRKAAKAQELVDNPAMLFDTIEKLAELSAPRAAIGGASEVQDKEAAQRTSGEVFTDRLFAGSQV